METYLSFFLLIVNVKTSVFGLTLPQYIFQENCGNTIGFHDHAGQITFKSSNVLYTPSDSKCDVRVSPKRLDNRNNQVMFYFTEFDLGASCQDSNLTLYDGRNSSKIKGLQDVLCGHNTSLEESKHVFNSTQNEIRLLFRWNEYGERFNGSFNLTFITYYKGPCSGDNNTFACSNNRCIASNISCSGDINYCGNGDDVNCDKLRGLVAGLVVFSIIGMFVLFGLVYAIMEYCKKRYGYIENVPIIRFFEDCECRLPNRSAGSMNNNASAGRFPTIVSGDRLVSDNSSTHSVFRYSDGAHDALQVQNTVPSVGSMNFNVNSRRSSITLSENNHVEQQEPFAPPMSEMTFSTPTSVV